MLLGLILLGIFFSVTGFLPKKAHATVTTYYVDSVGGLDSNSGTDSGYPWQTVAKVNASSFNPGDSVLFKRGDVWREELTVSSSGTAGNLITFGAYGSGAMPIINGTNIVTRWSQSTSGVTEIQSSTSNSTRSFRDSLSHTWLAQGFTVGATGWNLATTAFSLDKVGSPTGNIWVEIWSSSSSLPGSLIANGISTYVDVSTVVGGSYNLQTFTFPTPPALSANTQYFAVLKGDFTIKSSSYVATHINTTDPYTGGLACIWNGTTWAGYSQDQTFNVISTSTPIPNVYQATVTTQPLQVFFNGTLGTPVASIRAITSPNAWFWSSNVLYAYSTSNPSTAFTNPGIEASIRTSAIYMSGKSYVVINGIQAGGSNAQYSGQIYIKGGSNDTVENCTLFYILDRGIEAINGGYHTFTNNIIAGDSGISGTSSEGIYIYQSSAFTGGSTVSNNTIHDKSGTGISIWSQTSDQVINGVTIYGNTLYNNAYSGLYLMNADNGVIYNNTAYNNTGEGYGIALSGSQNSLVYDNTTYGNKLNGIATGQSVSNRGCNNDKIYQNNVYGNGSSMGTGAAGIYLGVNSPNTQVYNNVVYNNNYTGVAGIMSGWGGSGAVIYNNTLYNNSIGIWLADWESDSNDITIKNNIIMNSSPLIEVASGVTGTNANYNVYYPTTGTLFSWSGTSYNFSGWQRLPASQDANSINADPLFTNGSGSYSLATDFTLQSTSPAIDAGVDLNINTDYAGKQRYDDPAVADTGSVGSYSKNYVDIGAYEYVTPPVPGLSSATHPSQVAWYSSATPQITVSPTSSTTTYKYTVDQTLATTLGSVLAGTASASATFTVAGGVITSDGTWYVHVAALNLDGDSSTTYATYTINYDATAPVAFVPTVATSSWTNALAMTVNFATTDASSGVASYLVKIDGGAYINNVTSPYNLDISTTADGAHTVTVKAIDNAGNYTEETAGTILLDKTPPTLGITVSSAAIPSITLSATDSSSGVLAIYYHWGSGADMIYSSSITAPIGTHTLSYYAVDNAGNISAVATRAFIVATTTTSLVTLSTPTQSQSSNLKVQSSPTPTPSPTASESTLTKIEKFFETKIAEINGQKVVEQVKFQIVDKNGNSIPNLAVTIHSDSQTATTDENGVVTFSNIAVGKHILVFTTAGETFNKRVSIADSSVSTGTFQAQILVVKAEKDATATWVWIVIGLLAVLVLIFGSALYMRRRRTI
jgi:parallel beta-helix repeat protein